jgi:hypothetical protein
MGVDSAAPQKRVLAAQAVDYVTTMAPDKA